MSLDPKTPELPADLARATGEVRPQANAQVHGAAARRAYSPPRLKQLGSVRDLTLGSMGGVFDGVGSMRGSPM